MGFTSLTTRSIKWASPCFGTAQCFNEVRAISLSLNFWYCHRSIVLTWEVSTWFEMRPNNLPFLLNAKATIMFLFLPTFCKNTCTILLDYLVPKCINAKKRKASISSILFIISILKWDGIVVFQVSFFIYVLNLRLQFFFYVNVMLICSKLMNRYTDSNWCMQVAFALCDSLFPLFTMPSELKDRVVSAACL